MSAGTLGQSGKRLEGPFREIADEPHADDADIVEARREVIVAHGGKALADGGDLGLDRPFGVASLAGDTLVDAAHQPRVRQHREMGIEQVAHLLRGGRRQALRLAFKLAQLLDRDGEGRGEAGALLIHLRLGDDVFGHCLIEMIADMRRADGDAR